jgi:hypothetical protein
MECCNSKFKNMLSNDFEIGTLGETLQSETK